jgi:hypothetical protein
MLKKVWHDPVLSKVIAAGIIAVLAAVAGVTWSPVRQFLLTASSVPDWLLGLLALVAVCAIVIVVDARRPRVHIAPVGEVEVVEDKTPGRGFPLKISRVLRNDSNQAIDVRVRKAAPARSTAPRSFSSGLGSPGDTADRMISEVLHHTPPSVWFSCCGGRNAAAAEVGGLVSIVPTDRPTSANRGMHVSRSLPQPARRTFLWPKPVSVC